MQIMNHYMALRSAYPQVALGVPTAVSLSELAAVLYCSERNVKFIVKKLQELGWIRWMPGRGRGNASRLTFCQPAGDLLLDEAIELAKRGQLQEAQSRIRAHQAIEDVYPRFMEWLNRYLGYESRAVNSGKLDILRVPVPKQPKTLDPAELLYALDCHLVRHIYDTLVVYDQETNRIRPHLAHHWETDDRGLSWTFYLRKGVVFHHGREMTAEDVRYSLERLRAMQTHNAWLVGGIERIEVLDDHRFRITLSERNHLFLHFLCFPPLSILPADMSERAADAIRLTPVGSGPFRLTRRDAAVIELSAHAAYFRERSHLDVVELWQVSEETYNQPGLIVNHYSPNVPSGGGWQSIRNLEQGADMLVFNLKKPAGIVHSRSFRRAVQLLIDRQRMIEELGGNRASVAYGIVPGAGPDEHGALAAADAEERGLAALKQSGYAGEPLTLEVHPRHEADALWLCDRLNEYGIRIFVAMRDEHGDLSSQAGGADLYRICMIVDDPLELSWLETLKHISVTYFDDGLNEEVEQAITDILKLPDRERRLEGMRALERRFADAGAVLYLLHKTLVTAYHPSLKGVAMNALGWVDFRNLWFKEDQRNAE